MPTNQQAQEAIDVYALAVGRVTGAWNYFHRTLGVAGRRDHRR